MCCVYFNDKSVIFTKAGTADRGENHENGHDCGSAISLDADSAISITKVLQKLENSKLLCVKTADPGAAFSAFASQFIAVDAAGGLVENAAGDILMIYRNGRWDLPKGHMEPGEDPAECAVREVGEETGLEGAVVQELIGTTLHTYKLDGRWAMKKTWWYRMGGGSGELKPQEEEGIVRVEWVPRSKVGEYARGSFASVRDLIAKALK